MKDYKNSSLTRKLQISKPYLEELFRYLNVIATVPPRLQDQIKNKLTGYYTEGYPILLKAEEVSCKCWFINSGMIIAYYFDHKNHLSAHTIFKAGEIAIVPNSFMTGLASEDYLIACPDTHLLEISFENIEAIHKSYPESEKLAKLILAYQSAKPRNRDKLLRYKGKERILKFYEIFPQVRGPDRKIKLMDKLCASYLMLADESFSRLLKQIDDEERKKKKRVD